MLQRAGDEGEGRAQLVGDVGEEAQLQVGELLLHGHLVLQPEDGEEDVGPAGQYDEEAQHVEHVGHGSLVEGGTDVEVQIALVVHPHAVAVGRADLQRIVAVGQVGVGGRALPVNVVPVPVEAFQAVGVAHVLGVGEVEGGEVQRERVLPVAELEPREGIQGFLERRVLAGPHQLAGDLQAREDNLGHIAVFVNLLRAKGQDTPVGAEGQPAFGQGQGGAFLEDEVLTQFLPEVVVEMPGLHVHAAQAVL